MTVKYTYLITGLLFWLSTLAFAQEGIPIIKEYSVENYHAGVENWDAIQGDNGLMYFANSEGVLEFDGVHWRLIETQNRAKIRCLTKSPEGIIYVGGDSELGYLSKRKSGQYVFVSLLDHCPEKYQNHLRHVWKVIVFKGKKFFLAEGAVIVFDEEDHFKGIYKEDIYLRSLFLIKNKLVAYSNSKGIISFDFDNNKFLPLYDKSFVLNRSLEFIGDHPQGGIRFHIFDKGFYRLFNGNLTLEKKNKKSPLDTDYIFCQGRANDLLLLGTTTNGLYALSHQNLGIRYHFDKTLGLNDNKVFAIYTDHDKNVWVCHENGLSYLELNSPVRLINVKLGINGTGYCTNTFDSTLFVGTSHGLFSYKPKNENGDGFYNFSLFKLIRQPIYFLKKKENSLLIGCLLEVFEYDGKELKVISKTRNNNHILPFPNRPDHYLVSHEEGFLLLKYNNGFEVVRQIKGVNSEVVDFEIDKKGNVWIVDSQQELLLTKISSELDSFIVVKKFKGKGFLKYTALSCYNEKLVIGTDKGLYNYDYQKGDFIPVKNKTTNNSSKHYINWIYNQNDEELWYESSFYGKGKLNYKLDVLSKNKDFNKANSLNSVIYGNKAFSFSDFKKSELAIGTSEGFLLYNLDFGAEKLSKADAYIRKIVVTEPEDTMVTEGVWYGEGNIYDLPLDQELTYVELQCASNYFYCQKELMYSFKLDGVDKEWSEWTNDNKVRYTLNGHGNYTFHIRTTSNYSSVSNLTTFSFNIEKPWYKTFWWYSCEIGLLILILSLSVYFNHKGGSKISKISAFMLVLSILTVFEVFSELIQDFIDAEGGAIFAVKIAINISIALSINPIEHWVRRKIIRTVPQQVTSTKEALVKHTVH